mmetsp:Transcript_14408/g.36332  ORF Transcript_14408/g.36332 Transcript_14408/m.36332 type:complete len:788 (+) Transcript_14408:108-2471(+)
MTVGDVIAARPVFINATESTRGSYGSGTHSNELTDAARSRQSGSWNVRGLGHANRTAHLAGASRNLQDSADSLAMDAVCLQAQDCTQCAQNWPTCAWCGTVNRCWVVSDALRKHAESLGQTHVVYSEEEFHSSYGTTQPFDTLSEDSRCGVWIYNPASCDHLKNYCSPFDRCSSCTRVGGCGFCYDGRRRHQVGRCAPGTRSGEIGTTRYQQICGTPAVSGLIDDEDRVGQEWLFRNWTEYYASGDLDTVCVDHCRLQQEELTSTEGDIKLGSARYRVEYPPGADCSWKVRPHPWPADHTLSMTLQFNKLAARGDSLRAYEAGRSGSSWDRGPEVSYAGCRPTAQELEACITEKTFSSDTPVVIAFESRAAVPSEAWQGGAWTITWHLERRVESAGIAQDDFGLGSSWILWFGLALLLVPVLAVLLFARLRCRNGLGMQDLGLGGLDLHVGSGAGVGGIGGVNGVGGVGVAGAAAGATTGIGGSTIAGGIGFRGTDGFGGVGGFGGGGGVVAGGFRGGFAAIQYPPPDAGIDIEVLERHVPSCRPCVIGRESTEIACSVCLADLQAGEEGRRLPCGHAFHRCCIDDWLLRRAACPLCREEVLPASAAHMPRRLRHFASARAAAAWVHASTAVPVVHMQPNSAPTAAAAAAQFMDEASEAEAAFSTISWPDSFPASLIASGDVDGGGTAGGGGGTAAAGGAGTNTGAANEDRLVVEVDDEAPSQPQRSTIPDSGGLATQWPQSPDAARHTAIRQQILASLATTEVGDSRHDTSSLRAIGRRARLITEQ